MIRKETRKWGPPPQTPTPSHLQFPLLVCSPQSPLPPYSHPQTYTRGTRESASMSGAAQPRCYAIDDLASYAASERTTQAAPQNADPNGMGSSNGYHQATIPPQIQPAASSSPHPQTRASTILRRRRSGTATNRPCPARSAP